MGMGYGAAYADVIENDKLKELFPVEFKALVDTGDLSELASAIANDEEIDATALKALETLQAAFAAKFAGLDLELGFHDEEQGDRYDDSLSGAFFSINGLYVLSDGAKHLGASNFERKFFVNFG